MNKKWVVTIFVAALLAAAVSATGVARQAEDPGVMLRAAIEKEEVEGDLQGAIDLYKAIVAKHSGQAAVAAKAQLRIGKCYEKLGNAEAVKAYEAVLSKFPKEADAVAEARGRLAELRKAEPAGLTMTRLLPPDANQLEAPTLSPDGTKLAGVEISTGQNLAVCDLTTGKLEYLTKYGWEKNDHCVWVPIWSPTGREIVHQDVAFSPGAGYELHITDLAGRSRVLMKNPDGGLAPCDWLANGSAIVAVRANKDKVAALGLISVKDGSFRELSPLKTPYETRGDMPSYDMSASADASPDGRFIAYSDGPVGGGLDIYIVSADGRTKTMLIDHPADDTEPRWSPDGRHIVFLSDRSGSTALWGVAVREGKAEGAPFMILEGMQNSYLASWTKSGLQTWSTVIMNEICVLDIDSRSHVAVGKPRVVEFPRSNWNLAPRWSPDGRHLSAIAYSASKAGGQPGETSLMVMPSEGGKVRNYKFDRAYAAMGGTGHWMPDGSQGYVVWDEEKRLFFGRLDMTSGEWKSRQIPSPEGFTGFMGMTWSADGKGFYYLSTAKEGAGSELVLQNIETGKLRTIFRGRPGENFGRSIRASRDYKRLAMSNDGVIVIVDVETGKVERIENEAKKTFFFPAWSPDGMHLVAKGEPEKEGDSTELYIVSLADGTFKRLDVSHYMPQRSQIITAPDWSPDGRRIAFDVRSWKAETNLIRNLIPEK
jgi:Tol biopolymer transport system component